MAKHKKLFISITVLIIILVTLGVFTYHEYNSKIPEDYMAVFHGGVGEETRCTYIYKIDNNQSNYGFKYINTTSRTKEYGSNEWDVKITKRGKIDWTDGAFGVAKENGAYSYVTLQNSDKQISIEDFQTMFLMN